MKRINYGPKFIFCTIDMLEKSCAYDLGARSIYKRLCEELCYIPKEESHLAAEMVTVMGQTPEPLRPTALYVSSYSLTLDKSF